MKGLRIVRTKPRPYIKLELSQSEFNILLAAGRLYANMLLADPQHSEVLAVEEIATDGDTPKPTHEIVHDLCDRIND